MIYGLYLSAGGASAQARRMDVIANNLANVATTGFKRDLALFQAYPTREVAEGMAPPGGSNAMSGGVALVETATDFAQGPLETTGESAHVAVQGEGFLHLGDSRREWLTRDGRLMVNAAGLLASAEDGMPVLGVAGRPIAVNRTEPFLIDEAGRVSQGGAIVGQMALVRPASPEWLAKAGNNRYRFVGRLEPAAGSIVQGALEGSGSNPVQELTALIDTSRAFEANVNLIKHQDAALGRLLEELPRMG